MTAVERMVAFNPDIAGDEEDPFTERRYRQFARHITPWMYDVLDIGCGTGRGGAVMKALQPSMRITGLDGVPDRIAVLDPLIYAAKICGFTQPLPLPAESFDAIVAGDFIEHLSPELVFPTLCELFRLLRLGGLLLLTTPNPHYLKNKLYGTSVLGGAHVSQHHIATLRRRLGDVGFSSIKIRGSGRVSIALGEWFPVRAVYGSYLAEATKW
jgi:SAM-dependent methyltransferase